MNLRREKRVSMPLQKAILVTMLLCFAVPAWSRPEEGGSMATKDPMIRITSLPTKLDIPALLAKVSDDVSRATGLDKNLITYYWQTFDYVYCPGCEGAGIKNGITFIDLYVPGFLTDDDVEKIMTGLAASLEKNAGIPRNSLFIHTHTAQLNRLYINGQVVTDWSQAGEPRPAASPAGDK